MNAALASHESLRKLKLTAAVLYDDFDFAARTAALLEHATSRSGEVLKWDFKPWSMDLLKPAFLANAALEETASADLIVVALCKTHRLPDELMDWLKKWAERGQSQDAALLVLCPEETAGPMSSWNRLKEFAEWRDLHFLGSHNLQPESLDLVQQLW